MQEKTIIRPTEIDLRQRLGKLTTFYFGWPIKPVTGTLIEVEVKIGIGINKEISKELRISAYGLELKITGIVSIKFTEEIGADRNITTVPKQQIAERHRKPKPERAPKGNLRY